MDARVSWVQTLFQKNGAVVELKAKNIISFQKESLGKRDRLRFQLKLEIRRAS